jgi:hypothetical protein
MYYSVRVKRNPLDADNDSSFAQDYFRGCEKHYLTQEEAQEYFQSFDDWEQDLLEIDSFPF